MAGEVRPGLKDFQQLSNENHLIQGASEPSAPLVSDRASSLYNVLIGFVLLLHNRGGGLKTDDEGTCPDPSLSASIHFNNVAMLLLRPQSGPVRCGLERHQDTHSGLWCGSMAGLQEASRQQITNVHVGPFPRLELSKYFVISKPFIAQTLLSSKLCLRNLLCRRTLQVPSG